ncbi:MAG TPA: UDP-N-acetylmuramoyl-L-alanine--D-glutamate ligase [Candidatus Limnocylindrales bacterium]
MTTPAALDLDGLTLALVREGALRDRPVTVLGLARSGIALARFFADAGARVTVYDGRPAAELGEAIAALGDRPIGLALGPAVDPASTWAGAALVATSPSITPDFPTTEPVLRAALRRLVDARVAGDRAVPALVSEADLFLRLCPVATVGVTGTKGKTTTSSLAAAILAADPAHPVILGGNIGLPLIERLGELTPSHRVVDELSELQLPTLSRGTTVAVYTNVTADHLDRHGSLEAYRAVKRRLAELVAPGGAVVINGEDPVLATYEAPDHARTLVYRRSAPTPGGLGLVDGWIVADGVAALDGVDAGSAATDGRIMPVVELTIPGTHNISNALAAVAAGALFGVDPDRIRAAAVAFTGVEHRLEPVATVDGVRFINDSQGTQPDAVAAALRAFDPPIVLIAGGRAKGIDLAALAPVVADRAAAAVLIGESGPDLEREFRAAGLARTERAPDLETAVRRADAIAREARATLGDVTATVLLSPAAASFDMFVDYAARGRAFKDAVADLAATRHPADGGQR